MNQAGYPPKMLQEIMGHASITTTLDKYRHLYPGEMDRYADRPGSAAEEVADDAGEHTSVGEQGCVTVPLPPRLAPAPERAAGGG